MGLRLNKVISGVMISCYEASALWADALQWTPLSTIGVNGLSSLMGQANRWWMALQLLYSLPLQSLESSEASVGAAVAALSQAGEV